MIDCDCKNRNFDGTNTDEILSKTKNPPLFCNKDGKNCYEKEKFTSCLVNFKYIKFS